MRYIVRVEGPGLSGDFMVDEAGHILDADPVLEPHLWGLYGRQAVLKLRGRPDTEVEFIESPEPQCPRCNHGGRYHGHQRCSMSGIPEATGWRRVWLDLMSREITGAPVCPMFLTEPDPSG